MSPSEHVTFTYTSISHEHVSPSHQTATRVTLNHNPYIKSIYDFLSPKVTYFSFINEPY